MSVPAAYAAVVFIWSTTPLGIVWSTESFSPALAALIRMGLATLMGLLVLRAMAIKLPWGKAELRSYLAAALGVYGAMYACYSASQYIPSGLISVLWSLSPVVSGIMAYRLLNEPPLSGFQWLSLLLSIIGMGVIFSDDLVVGQQGGTGVLLLLLGVSLFSLSAVLVKKVAVKIHPLAQTVGSMLLSLPFYGVSWLLFEGAPIPDVSWGDRSLWAVFYLALFGSLVGFICYFYVLQQLTAKSVALVTLITPVFAMLLGSYLNGEPVTINLAIGSGLIIVGLAIYFWGKRVKSLLQKYWRPASAI